MGAVWNIRDKWCSDRAGRSGGDVTIVQPFETRWTRPRALGWQVQLHDLAISRHVADIKNQENKAIRSVVENIVCRLHQLQI